MHLRTAHRLSLFELICPPLKHPVSSNLNAEQQRTLITLSVGAFASQSSVRLCDPMLPQLAKDFSQSIGEVAMVITSFSIAYGLFQLIHGPMGDYAGKLRWIRYASIAAALASGACMLAASLPQLLALRFIAGAACAALIPLSLAWIGDEVPYQARQAVLAQFMTGSTAGAVFGQVAGGVMADTLGWRLSFAIPAFVLVAVAIALTLSRPSVIAPARSQPPTARSIAMQFEAVLQRSWARVMLAVVFFEGLVVYGAFAYVPSWLHIAFDMPLWRAGLAAAGFGLGGVVYSLGASYLIRTLGEQGLLAAGGLVFALGLSLVGGSGWPEQMLFCTFMGLGFFMVHNTLQVQATQMAPHARGTAIAAFAVGLFSGQSIGVAIGSNIMNAYGFRLLQWGSASLFVLLALVTAFLVRRRQRNPDE